MFVQNLKPFHQFNLWTPWLICSCRFLPASFSKEAGPNVLPCFSEDSPPDLDIFLCGYRSSSRRQSRLHTWHNSHHHLRLCDNRNSPFIASRKSIKTFLKSLFRNRYRIGLCSPAYYFCLPRVLSHLSLDWLTTNGIPLFYPFIREAYSAELFFQHWHLTLWF